MTVTVVQVGYVRVRMDDVFVTMRVLVPGRGLVGVIVMMVSVVVHVFVVVLESGMGMVVRVPAAQHEAHADCRDHQRRDLPAHHRISKHRPRNHRTHEWRRRENKLSASCAEVRAARMQVQMRDRRGGYVRGELAVAEPLRVGAQRALEIARSGCVRVGCGLDRNRGRRDPMRVPRARERSDQHERREERGAESLESLHEPHGDEENRRGRRCQSAASP